MKFDGFQNNVLQNAKAPAYNSSVSNGGTFKSRYRGCRGLLNRATRQVAAANETPVEWSVAESNSATAIRNLLQSNGTSEIKVEWLPPKGLILAATMYIGGHSAARDESLDACAEALFGT